MITQRCQPIYVCLYNHVTTIPAYAIHLYMVANIRDTLQHHVQASDPYRLSHKHPNIESALPRILNLITRNLNSDKQKPTYVYSFSYRSIPIPKLLCRKSLEPNNHISRQPSIATFKPVNRRQPSAPLDDLRVGL